MAGKTTMFALPLEERDRRWKKIREAMDECGFKCLIAGGPMGAFGSPSANLRYLIGIGTVEGYLVFPLVGEPTLYSFWGGLEPICWVEDWRGAHPMYSKAISERLRELHLEGAKIGVVGLSGYYGELGFPHTAYTSIANNFPKAKFEDATDIVEEARMIKSNVEIRCLEVACEVGEKVIQAVVDTAKIGVRDYEIRGKMMDTMERNSCEPASMILYCQGKEVLHGGQSDCYYEPAFSKALERGDVILAEFDANYLGYKGQFNQTFSVGEPNKELRDIFNISLESFNSGFEALRPGITVGELDEAFLSPIKEAGYQCFATPFHGLGLGIEEPFGSFPAQPNYKPNTSRRIKAGMVLEFEPHVTSLDGKRGIHLGCPVLVTETGCRLLTTNWKPEFKIV